MGRNDVPLNRSTYKDPNFLVADITAKVNVPIVIITKDKLYNILKDKLKLIARRWIFLTPLAITITLISAVITSNFKDWIFTSEEWKALYVVGSLVSIGLLLIFLIQSIKYFKIDENTLMMDIDKEKCETFPLSKTDIITPLGAESIVNGPPTLGTPSLQENNREVAYDETTIT